MYSDRQSWKLCVPEGKRCGTGVLSGDRESRIHHLMEKHKVKRHEAESVIEKTESRRKQYHMYYTGEDWGYAANYDLCINDTRFGIEGTADIIMQYVKDCNAQENREKDLKWDWYLLIQSLFLP